MDVSNTESFRDNQRLAHLQTEAGGFGFPGRGREAFWGRWNSRGTAMVYTSDSSSLAILELAVHFEPQTEILATYRLCETKFDDGLVETLDKMTLPTGWKNIPAPFALQKIGDKWVKENSSAVLCVPSAVNPTASNYLFNPMHPDFNKIEIGTPTDLPIDPRLLP